MKLNKLVIQRLISSLFAFLLTLLLVIFYVFVGLGLGTFNGKSIDRAIDESNYYNSVFDELRLDTEKLVTEVGLPTSVLTDAITLERVYISGRNYIETALVGGEEQIKLDKLHNQLTDNISQYLLTEKLTASKELEQGISKVITTIETEYSSAIRLQMIHDVVDYKSQYFKLLKVFLPIIVALITILCYFLIRMQHYKHRGVRYITYALLASSLLILLTTLYLLLTKQYEVIKVTPDYYQHFISAYLRWDMMIFLYLAGIGLTISIALISFINYLKSKTTNK